MSNHLAIATVTATLRNLVQTAINEDVAGATVSGVRPTTDAEGLTAMGVNIFFYQAVPNAAWRNADLPTRSGNGALVQRPTIALDLHYLLTFHGSESTLEPQRLMGSAVRALHARPVLTAEMVRATLDAAQSEDPSSPLLESDLADDVERVKLTPVPFNLEELSKLWSVMLQTPYTLCMGYLATVVLLQADGSPRRALPVRERVIGVAPFQRAVLERVEAEGGPSVPVEMGDTVVLRGSQLGGTISGIRVGVADELLPVPGTVGSRSLRLALTDPGLRAGVLGVRIGYAGGAASNVAPLVLRPRIVQTGGGDYDVTVSDLTTEDGLHSATITVVVTPEVEPEQPVELLLNAFRPAPDPGPAHRFAAEPRETATDTLTFAVAGVEPGTWLVRVQVSGAETTFDVEVDETDPDFGYYVQPSITLP